MPLGLRAAPPSAGLPKASSDSCSTGQRAGRAFPAARRPGEGLQPLAPPPSCSHLSRPLTLPHSPSPSRAARVPRGWSREGWAAWRSGRGAAARVPTDRGGLGRGAGARGAGKHSLAGRTTSRRAAAAAAAPTRPVQGLGSSRAGPRRGARAAGGSGSVRHGGRTPQGPAVLGAPLPARHAAPARWLQQRGGRGRR